MAYVNKFLEHLASETEATFTAPHAAGALLGSAARDAAGAPCRRRA